MIEHKDKILKVFPEMEGTYVFAEKELLDPGCKGCRRNGIMRKIKMEYAKLVNKFPERNIEGLPQVESPKQVIKQIHVERRAPFKDMRTKREPCDDCVLKHLSNAYAINTEIPLGYSNHHEEAASQVELAYSFADNETKQKLLPVVTAYHVYRLTEDIQYLKRAHFIIKSVLDSISTEDRYRLIGHLCQAEEECWQGDIELAKKIREERLKVMADKTYIPDLLPLLKEVDELVSIQ